MKRLRELAVPCCLTREALERFVHRPPTRTGLMYSMPSDPERCRVKWYGTKEWSTYHKSFVQEITQNQERP